MDTSKYGARHILHSSIANNLNFTRTGSTKHDLEEIKKSWCDHISTPPCMDTSKYGARHILHSSIANNLDCTRTGSTKHNLEDLSISSNDTIPKDTVTTTTSLPILEEEEQINISHEE